MILPEARCGTTASAKACTAAAFSSNGRPRSTVPKSRARFEHHLAQRHLCLGAGADPDDNDPALERECIQVALEVGGADQLQNDRGAAEGLRALDEVVGCDRLAAERGDPLAQLDRANGREHPGARRHPDLDGRRADAAVGAVDDEHVAERQSGLCADRVVGGDEHLRDARCLELAEVLGHCGQMPLVSDNAIGEPAAADDAEHAVALRNR